MIRICPLILLSLMANAAHAATSIAGGPAPAAGAAAWPWLAGAVLALLLVGLTQRSVTEAEPLDERLFRELLDLTDDAVAVFGLTPGTDAPPLLLSNRRYGELFAEHVRVGPGSPLRPLPRPLWFLGAAAREACRPLASGETCEGTAEWQPGDDDDAPPQRLHWRLAPVRANNRYYFVEVIRDAAATRQLEEALLEAREEAQTAWAEMEATTLQLQQAIEHANQLALAAEIANEAKSDFLAGISHEIRTPMNGIIGMTELALDTELSAEQREYLNLVRSSAEALLTLINDILDFSKIEAGKIEMDSVPFDLHEVVHDAINTLSLRAHQKGLDLVCQVRPNVPRSLTGDPGRIRQILLNLLGNAVKFTSEGQVVVRWELEAEQRDVVVLHALVQDTGIGIAPDKQQRVFQAFVQAEDSTTRKYGGTGLGLAISKQLVEMMGGEIWVESEPNVGSTFHFTLRLQLAENPTPHPALPQELVGAPVLVVDDSQAWREAMAERLQAWGLQPVCIGDPTRVRPAVEQARHNGRRFVAALWDLGIDHADARDIVFDPAMVAAPIVVVPSVGQHDANRARQLGSRALLTKPFSSDELLEALVSGAGRETPAAEARPQPAAARPKAPAANGPHYDILLVEDNPVNQKLAIVLLEKHGHEVTLADNGRRAIEILEKRAFDIVLMDVQMPEMNGFQATAAIREAEAAGRPRTPIVAMTAHAMRGDQERCLEAGMDAYLSKPIQAEALLKLLAELIGPRDATPDEAPRVEPLLEALPEPVAVQAEPLRPVGGATAVLEAPVAIAPALVEAAPEPLDDGPPPMNVAAALERCGDDRELLAELVALFLDDCPQLLEQLRQGLAGDDAELVSRSAHTLKGAVSNFSAGPAAEAALVIEELGRQGNLADVPPALAALEAQLARLEPALRALVG